MAPLKKYTEMEPSNPAGYYQLALSYARTGNRQEAERLMALQREVEKKQQKTAPTTQDITQPH
jgi:predicted Zn-dependent protease